MLEQIISHGTELTIIDRYFLQGQTYYGDIGWLFLSTIAKGLFKDPILFRKGIFQSEHGKYTDIVEK
jgi:hypothetical protein